MTENSLVRPILPVLLYGAEAWILLSTDAAALGVFERKVLSKIFGPVLVGNDFRIRFNSKLYELLNDMNVVQRINIQKNRNRWVHAMEIPKSAFQKYIEDWKNAGISVLYLRGITLKGTRQLLINKYLQKKLKITVIFLLIN